ncbi:MAG: ABC transporter permease [Sneathiella sp.]|nr:ABC transporter permease [Sneathiella sp.]
MTIINEYEEPDERDALKEARRARVFTAINKSSKYLTVLGLGWVVPVAKIAAGDSFKEQGRELWQTFFIPMIGMAFFIGAWALLAPQVKTSLGTIPGPMQVIEQVDFLIKDHQREREKEEAFHKRVEVHNLKLIAAGKADKAKPRRYTGKPTYFDQIITSVKTVAVGFIIATLIAVPLGIAAGLSRTVTGALNPLIQIFKPVSPLAWLPIVTMVVSATYVNTYDGLSKSLVVSAVTVTLCSLWPTLINTTLGVASIDKELMNVTKVLQLPTWKVITKLVLPSSLPLIFTGMRLSLGVGWMVLIAAEMLAQNPGLGKFVWDEFQNGSSSSLAKIIVAILTIGLIGFLLDRLMFALQSAFTFSANR